MEESIVAINTGSASHKYALYTGENMVLSAHYERTEKGFALTLSGGEPVEIPERVFTFSREDFFDRVAARGVPLGGIGVRVVAPGTPFTAHHRVGPEFLSALFEAAEYDPVHVLPVHDLIATLLAKFPSVPIVAVSDSAFHSGMPAHVRSVALPREIVEAHDLAHFGYHGIALSALSREYRGTPRTVVCHLGSGTSVTALAYGASADTSMGFSPLSGPPMSARSGALDPALVALIAKDMTPQVLLHTLYHESGLKALGGSDDMRVLLSRESTDSSAAQATRAYTYRVAQYVGAYAITLGGLDTLVFSGTIGERSAPIREKICALLVPLGIWMDGEKNAVARHGEDIHASGTIPIHVRHADETREVARIAARVLAAGSAAHAS